MFFMFEVKALLFVLFLSHNVFSFIPIASVTRSFGSISVQKWGDISSYETRIINPIDSFRCMGDLGEAGDDDIYSRKKKAAFNLNVGRAMEVLRRELPGVFVLSKLDFSIFAASITVCDSNQNRMVMQKNLYSTAVKSLRMAASFSSMYPSMNVRKIEYVEGETTIQCLVEVVLPDSVRVDGQSVWEGMFYFGLDEEGLISSHVFDRKISNLRPSPPRVSAYPWLRASPASWSADLLGGGAVRLPRGGLVTACSTRRDELDCSSEMNTIECPAKEEDLIFV